MINRNAVLLLVIFYFNGMYSMGTLRNCATQTWNYGKHFSSRVLLPTLGIGGTALGALKLHDYFDSQYYLKLAYEIQQGHNPKTYPPLKLMLEIVDHADRRIIAHPADTLRYRIAYAILKEINNKQEKKRFKQMYRNYKSPRCECGHNNK